MLSLWKLSWFVCYCVSSLVWKRILLLSVFLCKGWFDCLFVTLAICCCWMCFWRWRPLGHMWVVMVKWTSSNGKSELIVVINMSSCICMSQIICTLIENGTTPPSQQAQLRVTWHGPDRYRLPGTAGLVASSCTVCQLLRLCFKICVSLLLSSHLFIPTCFMSSFVIVVVFSCNSCWCWLAC